MWAGYNLQYILELYSFKNSIVLIFDNAHNGMIRFLSGFSVRTGKVLDYDNIGKQS